MYGLDVDILLTYGSQDARHVDFRGLTVVNETLRFWGVTRVQFNVKLWSLHPDLCFAGI